MVDTGLLDWAGVADRMSARPAAIGRLPGHGQPAGRRAARRNLILVRPGRADRGRWTPPRTPRAAATARSRAWSCPGQVVATFLRGTPTVLDGKLA